MTTTEPALRERLEEWRVSGSEPEWDDVLRRARASGKRARRRVALAAAVAVAVAAAPAFALSDALLELIRGDSKRTVLSLQAMLRDERGAPAGRLVLQVPRGAAERPGRPLVLWRFALTGARGVVSTAELRTSPAASGGRTLVRLCAPCPHGASRSVRTSPTVLRALLAGGAYAVVTTERGALSGRVRRAAVRHVVIRRP